VGDFNRWDPNATPLRRSADGRTWTVAVPLPSGRHVYAFVVDGGLTADPTAPRAAGDDFGEPSSVVVVSETST
jgi:1,4-alpha-glucan branching enzyme